MDALFEMNCWAGGWCERRRELASAEHRRGVEASGVGRAVQGGR